MSRGVHSFRQNDVVKAIKAAAKAGVKRWRVEITNGKIVVRAGDEDAPVGDERDREWD